MSDEVLQAYITLQPTPKVQVVWQGDEPALLGLNFYKRAIELLKRYAGQKDHEFVTN